MTTSEALALKVEVEQLHARVKAALDEARSQGWHMRTFQLVGAESYLGLASICLGKLQDQLVADAEALAGLEAQRATLDMLLGVR